MGIQAIQNDFSSGELSPNVWSRPDRPFYKTGLEVCRNFFPLLTGGLKFRPGTEYSVHSRLNRDAWGLPFRFNIDQSYSLEFTESKIRIHQDGGIILETAKNITGITNANPGVITSVGHGFSSGDEVWITGIAGLRGLNGQFFLVVYIGADTFSLTDIDGNAINTTSMGMYTSGGTVARVYEIISPYTIAEAKTLKFCGTADLMYLFCKTREPRVLIRSGNTSWSVNTYTRYSSELAISGITQASPGVITSTAHGLVSGDRIYLSHIKGMEELNGSEYLVVYINANTFSLTDLAGSAINTSAYKAYSDGGDIAIVRDVGKTITGITKASPGVITISAHGYATNDKVYISGVGGMTELNGFFFWVKKIDADTFSLMDELGNNIDTTAYTTFTSGGTVSYIHGLFTKLGDFPEACGLYGGRFFAGGTDNDPDTNWASMGPDSATGMSQYDDFTIGTEDVDGMVFIIPSQAFTADRIYWYTGNQKFLCIGTSGGVYKVTGGSDGAAITPTSIVVSPVSNIGVKDLMPVVVDNQTYYVEQGGETLRAFGYSLMDDEYKSFDKNVVADEIAYGGILQLCFARGRPDLVFAIRADNVLLSCTILEQNNISGWSRHYFGGSGKVLSVVIEPRTTGADQVGLIIERTIDGYTRRYIEYFSIDPRLPAFSDYFTGENNYEDDREIFERMVFETQIKFVRLDSAVILDTTQETTLTLAAVSGEDITVTAGSSIFAATDIGRVISAKYLTGEETGTALIIEYTSGTQVKVQIIETFSSTTYTSGAWYFAANEIGGVGHLEGETLGVLTDGAVHPDTEVIDGTVTFDYPVRYAIVGLRYTGFFRTLDLTLALSDGSDTARLRNIEQLFLRVRDALGGKIGSTKSGFYKLTALLDRREKDSYWDRPPALFSGMRQVLSRDTWENEKRIVFVQDDPLPFTALAFIASEDEGAAE